MHLFKIIHSRFCKILRACLTMCLLFFFAASSCEKRESLPSKPIVLVSVPSYLYFINRIAGDTVTAHSLIPAGANPHIYEPAPKQVQQFRQAVLWIRLGELSEKKTYTILKDQSCSMRIVDITQGIPLLPFEGTHSRGKSHHCGRTDENDLHIWLSPKLAKQQAKTIASHLCDLFPQNRERYEKALASFLMDLDVLDKEITALLFSKKGSAILVSHPAFSYFCQDYDLTQLSIEIEGKDPLPQNVTSILKKAREYKVATIIIEPQYSDKGAQLIAECLKLPLCIVDPYAEDYLKNMKHIAEIAAKS